MIGWGFAFQEHFSKHGRQQKCPQFNLLPQTTGDENLAYHAAGKTAAGKAWYKSCRLKTTTEKNSQCVLFGTKIKKYSSYPKSHKTKIIK